MERVSNMMIDIKITFGIRATMHLNFEMKKITIKSELGQKVT